MLLSLQLFVVLPAPVLSLMFTVLLPLDQLLLKRSYLSVWLQLQTALPARPESVYLHVFCLNKLSDLGLIQVHCTNQSLPFCLVGLLVISYFIGLILSQSASDGSTVQTRALSHRECALVLINHSHLLLGLHEQSLLAGRVRIQLAQVINVEQYLFRKVVMLLQRNLI